MVQLSIGPTSPSKGLVALGSNASHDRLGPRDIVTHAIIAMPERGLDVTSHYKLFVSPAFPPGAGAEFVNTVVRISTPRPPFEILETLHSIERDFGRIRNGRWTSRTLDLDLIALDGEILPDRDTYTEWRDMPLSEQARRAPDRLILPHPRIQDRAFVLKPLSVAAPDWRHPVSGLTAAEMLDALPEEVRAAVKPL